MSSWQVGMLVSAFLLFAAWLLHYLNGPKKRQQYKVYYATVASKNADYSDLFDVKYVVEVDKAGDRMKFYVSKQIYETLDVRAVVDVVYDDHFYVIEIHYSKSERVI